MWITFSLFLQYSYVLASVQCENHSHNDMSFPATGVHWTIVVWAPATPQLGLGHATISDIWITIYFTINVINKFFGNKHLILVFLFCFSVALAQKTTGLTTATTMAAAGRNGPLAPHMRPCAPRQCVKWMGDNPPSLRMCFWGGWGCLWLSKRFRRWCIATKSECFEGHAHPNSPQNYIR